MIEMNYVFFVIVWVILIIGFYYRNYPITVIGGIFLITLGIWCFLEGFDVDSWLNESLGISHLMMGVYIFLRGTWEQYKDL